MWKDLYSRGLELFDNKKKGVYMLLLLMLGK